MIGKTFSRSWTERGEKKVVTRKILSEFLQFERRFYVLRDPESGKSFSALADDFDREFKVTASTPFIHRKGYKGKSIVGKQKSYS